MLILLITLFCNGVNRNLRNYFIGCKSIDWESFWRAVLGDYVLMWINSVYYCCEVDFLSNLRIGVGQ